MQRLVQFAFAIVMLVAGLVGLAMTTCGGFFLLSSMMGALQLSLFALVSIGLGAMLVSGAWKYLSKVIFGGTDE